MNEIKLIDNLKISIGENNIVKTGPEENNWGWRIIVDFISNYPEENKLIKSLYIWINNTYVKNKGIDIENKAKIEELALNFAKDKYELSGNEVPIENGFSISYNDGEIIVDPKDYSPN